MPVFSMNSKKYQWQQRDWQGCVGSTATAAQEVRCVTLDATQRGKIRKCQQTNVLPALHPRARLPPELQWRETSERIGTSSETEDRSLNGVPQTPVATATAIKAIMMEGKQPNFQTCVCCQLKYKVSLGGVFWKRNLNWTPSSSNACKTVGMRWGSQVMGSKGVHKKWLFGSACEHDSPNTNYWGTRHSSSASSPSTMWCACRKKCKKQPRHLTSLLNTTDLQFRFDYVKIHFTRINNTSEASTAKVPLLPREPTSPFIPLWENKNLSSPRHKATTIH